MSKPLIYLFEDDPSLQRLLVEVLEEELNARVVVCAHPGELPSRSGSAPPDAIVADFWGTSHMLLSEAERSEIAELAQLAPLVLVSARGWLQHTQAQELGVAGLMRKPLELDEFVGVVRDALVWAPAADAGRLGPREALSLCAPPELP